MTDVLDKIHKLVALSTSSHAEEARTAAFMAVKLIREHGIVLSYSASYRPPPPPKPKSHGVPPARTRREIQEIAEAKAARFLEFLKKKAKTAKEYPVFSLTRLTAKSVADGLVTDKERATFHYLLGEELRKLVRAGKLVSLVGSKGGYRLPEKVRRTRAQATAA